MYNINMDIEYHRQWEKQNKRKRITGRKIRQHIIKEIIYQEKNNMLCVDCHNSFHFSAMDFDHIDHKTKSFEIARAWKQCPSIETLINELLKCEIRCANCHRHKSYSHSIHNIKLFPSNTILRKRKLYNKINQLKMEQCCKDCETSYYPWQLEYDHREPKTKYMAVSIMIKKCLSFDSILFEITKCDLVCVNCHRVREWNKNH